MRFHHSTRRGRSSRYQHSVVGGYQQQQRLTSSRGWSQVNYCRETNILFNRRQVIEPPLSSSLSAAAAESNREALRRKISAPNMQNDKQGKTKRMTTGYEEHHQLRQQQRKAFSSTETIAENSKMIPATQPTNLNKTISFKSERLDMTSVREKLIAQVNKHPFWSNKAAKRMELSLVEERDVFLYELQSYCERRELEWKFEPYTGGLSAVVTTSKFPYKQPSTSPEAAKAAASSNKSLKKEPAFVYRESVFLIPPPKTTELSDTIEESAGNIKSRGTIQRTVSASAAIATSNQHKIPDKRVVWAIEVPARLVPALTDLYPWQGSVYSKELPDSSFVKKCHCCQGKGRLKCASCYGVGYEVCLSCSGKGTTKSLSSSHSMANTDSRSTGGKSYHDNSRNSNNSWYDKESSLFSANADSKRSYGEPGGITSSSGTSSSGGGFLSSSSAWATESCHLCHGAGQKRCWICSGRAYIACQACHGSGKLRCYLNMVVTWINHRDEFLLNLDDNVIPKDRLKLSSGLCIAQEEADQLRPISELKVESALRKLRPPEARGHFTSVAADADEGTTLNSNNANNIRANFSRDSILLNANSRKLLERHQSQHLQQERLVRQRHRVVKIECFIVRYELKKRSGHFVIYGDERKIYIAKYPFKSICNIT